MMPSDPIQAMEFAQSKGQARKDGRTGVTFGDIAGMEATKKELQQIVQARGSGFRARDNRQIPYSRCWAGGREK